MFIAKKFLITITVHSLLNVPTYSMIDFSSYDLCYLEDGSFGPNLFDNPSPNYTGSIFFEDFSPEYSGSVDNSNGYNDSMRRDESLIGGSDDNASIQKDVNEIINASTEKYKSGDKISKEQSNKIIENSKYLNEKRKRYNVEKFNTYASTACSSSDGKKHIFNIDKIKKSDERISFNHSIFSLSNGIYSMKNVKIPYIADLAMTPPQEGFNPLRNIVKVTNVKRDTNRIGYFLYNYFISTIKPEAFSNAVIADFANCVIYTGIQNCRRRKNNSNSLSGNTKLRLPDDEIDKEKMEEFKNTICSFATNTTRTILAAVPNIIESQNSNCTQKSCLKLFDSVHSLILSTKALFKGIFLYNEIAYGTVYFLETAKNCLGMMAKDDVRKSLIASLSKETLVIMQTSFKEKECFQDEIAKIKPEKTILELLAQNISDNINKLVKNLNKIVTNILDDEFLNSPSVRGNLLKTLQDILNFHSKKCFSSYDCKLINPTTNKQYDHLGNFFEVNFVPKVNDELQRLTVTFSIEPINKDGYNKPHHDAETKLKKLLLTEHDDTLKIKNIPNTEDMMRKINNCKNVDVNEQIIEEIVTTLTKKSENQSNVTDRVNTEYCKTLFKKVKDATKLLTKTTFCLDVRDVAIASSLSINDVMYIKSMIEQQPQL